MRTGAGQGPGWRRRSLAGLALLPLAACALPPNTALRDWAWRASIAADRPGDLAGSDGGLAMQAALAAWLYALGVLAVPEQRLTYRAGPFEALAPRAAAADPAAGEAILRIGAVLEAARDANLPLGARANSAHPATLVEDNRLRPALRAAAAPVLALAGALGGAAAGAPEAYRRLIAAIAEDHAMIAAQLRHIEAREVARRIQEAEDRLRRLARLLPPDPVVAARGGAGGPVAALVQP